MANFSSVCSLAGPATPMWIGSLIPSAASRSAQAITGPASKQNWVAIAIFASVRSENACFHASACITMRSLPSASMSLLPSGWPATCSRSNPAKSPVSISCIELWNSPAGVFTPPPSSSACFTSASP